MNRCIDCGIELSNIPDNLAHLKIFRCIRCFGHYDPIKPATTKREDPQRGMNSNDTES